MPAGIGGMPFSVNRASERQSADQLALALHDVEVEAGLVVGVGRERLRRAARDGRVAVDQLLDDAAHHLEPERQRHDVEQQHVVVAGAAREQSAWTAAPSATTWSGSMSASGSCPNSSSTKPRTSGMRVAPPTRITPDRSPALDAGVLERAAAAAGAQRSSTGATSASSSRARQTAASSARPAPARRRSPPRSRVVSASLSARAASSTRRTTCAIGASSAHARARQQRARRSRDRSRRRRAPSRRRSPSPRTRRRRASGSRRRTCRRRDRTPRTSPRACLSRP